jgi:radical SAM superfamily enzyme YgiQ (UPF0313 family)
MRILLYYPESDAGQEYMKYPLGILYLAAVLKNEHEVLFYDAKVDNRPIKNVIHKFDPDIVGVSFTTGSKRNAFEMVKNFPERFFIAGGFHPSVRPEECLHAGFNVVVRGEAELTLPRILRLYEKGAKLKELYDGEKVQDLDLLPFPARELIPSEYFKKYNQAAIIGSRGCNFGCKFCGSARTGLRKRSPENIVSELEEIIHYHPNQPIHFCDDNFTYDLNWVTRLTHEIKRRGLQLRYSINSRVDVKDYDVFKILKDSGCEVIAYGIEAGSQEILNLVGKGITIEQIKKTVKATKEAGLIVRTNWIIGLPGSYSEQLKSIDLMKELSPHHIHVSLNTPYPGTVYGDNPGKHGIHIKTDDWTNIFNNIYSTGDFSKVIYFDFLSYKQILDITTEMKEEMQKQGIKIRTFLDKKLMDFFNNH